MRTDFLLALKISVWAQVPAWSFCGGRDGRETHPKTAKLSPEMKPASLSNSPAAPIRVVLVDHHASLRGMLMLVLEMEGVYDVVGEAAGGMEGLKVCRAKRPQLVILDLALPELSGPHFIRLLLAEDWPVRVLVYTGTTDDGLLREALAEEPHGFVRKEDTLQDFRAALHAVTSGSRHISPWASRLMPLTGDGPRKRLTTQECAVLQMIAEGRQTKEIATVLGVSPKTVEHHRQHLMDKVGLHDVASLTRYAVRHRMVGV
jgi:DNA-binding NarL/FixJ family response regulator